MARYPSQRNRRAPHRRRRETDIERRTRRQRERLMLRQYRQEVAQIENDQSRAPHERCYTVSKWTPPHDPETGVFDLTDPATDDPCVICMGELSEGGKIATLPCDHKFHTRCINKWFEEKKSDSCPTCRTVH